MPNIAFFRLVLSKIKLFLASSQQVSEHSRIHSRGGTRPPPALAARGAVRVAGPPDVSAQEQGLSPLGSLASSPGWKSLLLAETGKIMLVIDSLRQ